MIRILKPRIIPLHILVHGHFLLILRYQLLVILLQVLLQFPVCIRITESQGEELLQSPYDGIEYAQLRFHRHFRFLRSTLILISVRRIQVLLDHLEPLAHIILLFLKLLILLQKIKPDEGIDIKRFKGRIFIRILHTRHRSDRLIRYEKQAVFVLCSKGLKAIVRLLKNEKPSWSFLQFIYDLFIAVKPLPVLIYGKGNILPLEPLPELHVHIIQFFEIL